VSTGRVHRPPTATLKVKNAGKENARKKALCKNKDLQLRVAGDELTHNFTYALIVAIYYYY